MNDAIYDYIYAKGRLSAFIELREMLRDALAGGAVGNEILEKFERVEVSDIRTMNEVWARRLSEAALEEWLGHKPQ